MRKMTTLQSEAKGKAAALLRDKRRTGGGPPPQEMTPMEESALAMVPSVSYEGVPSGVDTSDVVDREENSEMSSSDGIGRDSPIK